MQVRKIAPEEMIQVRTLEAQSFFYPIDVEAVKKELAEHPEENGYRNVWACFAEDGRLVSSLQNWPYRMHYDGSVVPAGGVCAVVSAPESRMQGSVRSIFHAMLMDDRAQGRVFSMLFPFSHAYYRKFGYELCHEGRTVRFPTGALKKYPLRAAVRMHRPEEGAAPFMALYDAYASTYTYALARDEAAWRSRLRDDPCKLAVFRYIFSREGRDVAYCMYKAVNDRKTGERHLEVFDYAYLDADALHSLFGFLYRLDAQAPEIRLELADGFDMSPLLDEPYELSLASLNRSMARVVNVEAALRGMRHPTHWAGAYSLMIQDDFLPENAGRYAVSFGPEGVAVRREKENACDLSMTVQTFAQLCLGYLSLDMALCKQDVRLAGNRQTLTDVFVRKNGFLTDRF